MVGVRGLMRDLSQYSSHTLISRLSAAQLVIYRSDTQHWDGMPIQARHLSRVTMYVAEWEASIISVQRQSNTCDLFIATRRYAGALPVYPRIPLLRSWYMFTRRIITNTHYYRNHVGKVAFHWILGYRSCCQGLARCATLYIYITSWAPSNKLCI